jgi:uncharacterized protein (TIGR02270 family)
MVNASRRVVPAVLLQHVEDAVVLRNTRSGLVNAPHVKLNRLRRLDDRLAAHLDALAVAGPDGWKMCMARLERSGPAEVFVATIRAIEDGQADGFEQVLAVAEAVGDTNGLISAFGWLESGSLQGWVNRLLLSHAPFRRVIGIAACTVHGRDFRISQRPDLRDTNSAVHARTLRAIGELGLVDSANDVKSAFASAEPSCSFWAAWSAVLLGNRSAALETLMDAALSRGPQRSRAFRLALQAMPVSGAHGALQSLAPDSKDLRWLIQGSGIVGDPTYVPWLIGHMSDDQAARLAGEAFSLITGTDLALLDLERKPPENFESGPNDDPDDPNVEMDPDDGLPWPDPDRVKDWWAKNSHRFQPGTRYFMGAPVTREHCIDVLKNGYQRQRILAAHYLCLLEPGTPLFNTSAPAWRQQKLLAQMS